jgi:surfactin synthase thioesterase subunit
MRPSPGSPRWFEPRVAGGDHRVRLLCFPHAGGSAFVFREWQPALPAAIGVIPIQLPGHGGRLRERPFTRLLPLVDVAYAALLPLLDRPFALFGHSLGAAIAFELARRFEHTHGRRAQHLFVAGRGAPDCAIRRPRIHDLPTPQLVAALRGDGLPAAILNDPEALEFFMPLLRADLEMSETHHYVPGPPLTCPVSVFGGCDDPWVTLEDLRTWTAHTSAACQVTVLPGGHFFGAAGRQTILRVIEQQLCPHPHGSTCARVEPR